jgi:uncharacterized protein YjiS (DUF1127 family)
MTISIHNPNVCTPRPVTKLSLWSKIGNAIALKRQRRQLLGLEDHLLKDVGLTRDDAIAENAQNLWDVPQTWRK